MKDILIKGIILSTLASSILNAAIVIEPKSINEVKTTEVKASISGYLNQGNTDSNHIQAGIYTQFGNGKTYKNLVIFSYDYGEANKEKNANKLLLHLRHTHKLYQETDIELFVQDEFNEFQNQKYRFLSGANLRHRLSYFDRLFIGAGLMYSEVAPQTEGNADITRKKVKINTYMAYEKKINKTLTFNMLLFFQPTLYNFNTENFKVDIEDFRLSSYANFETKITKELSFTTGLNYFYHSKPFEGIEKDDLKLTVGINYKFK